MPESSSNAPSDNEITAAVSNRFSSQPTGLVETTFAETLGLSMHNAVTSQQSSQMTTAASITNACARLLQTGIPQRPVATKAKKAEPASTAKSAQNAQNAQAQNSENQATGSENSQAQPKKKFNIMNFLKPKNKSEQPTQRTEPTTGTTSEATANNPTEAQS